MHEPPLKAKIACDFIRNSFASNNAFTILLDSPLPDNAMSKSSGFALLLLDVSYPVSLARHVTIPTLDDNASTRIPAIFGFFHAILSRNEDRWQYEVHWQHFPHSHI